MVVLILTHLQKIIEGSREQDTHRGVVHQYQDSAV